MFLDRPTRCCRVCDSEMALLLAYKNMPKSAQNFPSAEELNNEFGADLRVCGCANCGLVQLSNKPVPYYKEVIRAAAFSEDMKQFRIGQFQDFVEKYSLYGKKVIEVGCGKGEFLSLMKDAGADVCGIEYADDSVEYCNKQGLNVSKHYIEYAAEELPESPYDCFFIMNFFEHLPDPNATLRTLHLNLTDNGIGLIEVPNFDMIIRNNLFSEFINDHLFYFTKSTLKMVLERNGFEIIECKEVWHDYIISAVVKKRPKVDLTSFNVHQEKIKNELQQYIERHGEGKIAVYGAGHQSLAILSLSEIGNSIEYVVDDATFKQGKYTPATHIPIVSNKALSDNPVGTVIIMAASYSDEVAKKVKNNFNIRIAILRDFGLEEIV